MNKTCLGIQRECRAGWRKSFLMKTTRNNVEKVREDYIRVLRAVLRSLDFVL